MVAKTVHLGEFIRRERSAIIARWERRARRAPVARGQSTSALVDSLPELLDRIAEGPDGPASAPASVSRRHAAERVEQGYALGEVVEEYTSLRACIFEHLEELGLDIAARDSRHVNHAVDAALHETTQRFVEVHERMLYALDRISAQPVARQSIDDVLSEILRALKETPGAAIDSVSLFLLEEDGRLHLRATIGLEDDLRGRFSVAMGEGFVGTVAATRRPLLLRAAFSDAMLVSPAVRARGTRALYGVPLVDDGRVIGVAHVGSCLASEFAEEDLILFRAMTNRAATIIVRAQFVETLERTAHFREQFLGVLAHDLRNPLGAILGTGRLLLENELSPAEVLASHQRIVRSATRMEALIRDILDFTRARLGAGFPLAHSRFALRDLAREVADELASRAGARDLQVEDGEDVSGSWDRERIAQVLSNLVSNAIEHSPDGTPVAVVVRRRDGDAEVAVSNAGPPIPDALRPKLFEPFEGTRGRGGLGLGLYIAKEIVRAHGGSLDVASGPRGTTFTLRLPLEAPTTG